MTWKELLEKRIVVRHKTAKTQIDEFRAFIRRDLRDASLKPLSLENRFDIAFHAAILTAKVAVFCAGYRLKAGRARYAAFKTLKLALGSSLQKKSVIEYLERCGKMRQQSVYAPNLISRADVEDLCKQTRALVKNVDAWIAKRHRKLA